MVIVLWGEGSVLVMMFFTVGRGVKTDRFKGSGVAGACVAGARFGVGVVINGFNGVV